MLRAAAWGYRPAMTFPRRLLSQGEELIMDIRPHWIALVAPIAETVLIVSAAALALIYMPNKWSTGVRWAVVLIAVGLFLYWPARRIVAWLTSHFVITTDRVIHRSGWFAKKSMEIPLENISDVRFNQSAFERVIGAGDLTLESPGTFGQETFGDIRKPELVQKTIYEMNEQNQRRMASSGASPLSVADEIAKLQKLRDDGVITDEEFQSQKDHMLGSS